LKRKINIDLGGNMYTFVTDESKEKVQRIKDLLQVEYQKNVKRLESTGVKGVDQVLVLLLLNHVSKEVQLEQQVKELEEMNQRLLLEIEQGRKNSSDMAI